MNLDLKKHLIRKNFYYYLRLLKGLCKFYFLSFLMIELFYLAFKFQFYNINRCFIHKIRKDFEYGSTFDEVRTSCWVLGFFKDRYDVNRVGTRRYETFTLSIDEITDKGVAFMTDENNFIELIFCSICGLTLIVFFLNKLQKQFNVFRPIINQLRDRCILNYCQFDRNQLIILIKLAVQKSRFHFYGIVLLQMVYQILLFFLIFATKLVLYGQYRSFDGTVDYKSFLLFPNLNEPKLTQESNFILDIQVRDLTYRKIFNDIFMILWQISLVIFVVYILLIIINLILYSVHSLRTQIILSFSPNTNSEVLYKLNYYVHNFYLLYKIACSIDEFYFSMMIDDIFYIKNDLETGASKEHIVNEGDGQSEDEKKMSELNGICSIDQNKHQNEIVKFGNSNLDKFYNENMNNSTNYSITNPHYIQTVKLNSTINMPMNVESSNESDVPNSIGPDAQDVKVNSDEQFV